MSEAIAWPEGPFRAGEAMARGLDARRLSRERAAGRVTRVRRDTYVATARWESLRSDEQHRLRVRAAARTLNEPVFSHRSAAAVWQLPLLGGWPDEVHVSGPASAGGRSRPGIVRHTLAGPVPAVAVHGVRVTSMARTVVDLARTERFAGALMAADAALHAGACTPAQLADELVAAGSGRGVVAARRVVEAADERAESGGESLSRARMIELGLPLPVLQHEVVDRGRVVARVDFWWPELNLVGEFDGRLKYRTDGVADRRSVEERLWEEKVREDSLRALGRLVVRWTWDDALRPDRLARLLARAGVLPVAVRR